MKNLALWAMLVAALSTSNSASAQAYPSRTVRIIVAYQPGQGTDVLTRYLAQLLSQSMHESFIVENRAGAGGQIGTSEAARASPDGYTLVMGTNGTHVLNQFLYPATPLDPEKQFDPIMLVSTFPMVMLATASSRIDTMSQLLGAAKANPDSLAVALPSTTAQLVLELLKQQSATSMRGIPYKGSGTSMADLIGGQLGLGIDTISASRSFIASGRLKALGVTSVSESALLPGVKSISDQGIAGFSVIAWNGLYAPHGTPPDIVRRLNAELTKIIARPDVRQHMLELAHEPAGGSPEELGTFARKERQKWGPVIEKSGIKGE